MTFITLYVYKKRSVIQTHPNVSFFFQAFSVFFVCVAFTSDIICLLFIPVQWLFFAASTYVWVQYVWHTGNINTLTLTSLLSQLLCNLAMLHMISSQTRQQLKAVC